MGRLPPDLVDDGEEYKVKKILDSQHFGRRHKLQYLVKWKGYPDSDNEWVDKNDIHANDVIREFKNQNPTSEMHINKGSMGKYFIPPHPPLLPTNNSHQHMSNVNIYYLGTPRCIFAAELNSGLITKTKAQELCAKKYICPTITNESAIVTPLTPEELEQVKLQFPDVAQAAVPAHTQSPMVRQLSDPDGMGATPTHQSNIQDINTNIWTAEESGESALPVPFRLPGQAAGSNEEGMLGVEGGAIQTSRCETKCMHHSLGSTALPSMLAMHGPWSHTTSMREEDLYPAEHLFIRTLKDTDDPNKTPYAATTSSYPLYKGSYGVLSSSKG